MPRKLRCLLLCEDIEQERLFRPILECQFNRIYVEPRRPRGGAGFVLQRLERLTSYIRQHHQEAVALLVVVDGDRVGLQRRLEAISRAAGFSGAAWEERIARCVPCRTVETWEIWLCGVHAVDEQTEYKEAFRREVEQGSMSGRKAAEAWFAPLTPERQKIEETHLPALTHGRKEMARLQRFANP